MKFIPNGTGKFRFWCQKVLPLVYDDSLSYYEVLCKLRDFVNNLAERIADAFDEINENLQEYVDEWLTDHPEATTTIADGSVTKVKINDSFLPEIENFYYTPEYFGAVGDGVTDDTNAFKQLLEGNYAPVLIPNKSYLITDAVISKDKLIVNNGAFPDVTPIMPTKAILNNQRNITYEFRYDLDNSTSYVEACCYNTKTRKVIVAVNDYSTNPATTKLKIIDPYTNTVETQYQYPFSTVNGMSYNEDTDEIIVCCIASGHYQNNGCQVVNGSTMAWMGQLDAPDNYPYYFYNNKCKTWAKVVYANDIYTLTIYDAEWNILEVKSFSVPNEVVQQDGEFTGSKFYQLSWTSIMVFDICSGEINRIGTKSMEELEGICVNGSKGYMTAHNVSDNQHEHFYSVSLDSTGSITYERFTENTIPIVDTDVEKITAEGKYEVSFTSNNLATIASTYHIPEGCEAGILEMEVICDDQLDVIATVQTFTSTKGYHGLFPKYRRIRKGNTWYQWQCVDSYACRWLRTGEGGAMSNAVKSIADSLPVGKYSFYMSTGTGGDELPSNETKWQYAAGEIIIRDSKLITNEECAKIILYSATNNDIAICTCWNGTWSGWTVK